MCRYASLSSRPLFDPQKNSPPEPSAGDPGSARGDSETDPARPALSNQAAEGDRSCLSQDRKFQCNQFPYLALQSTLLYMSLTDDYEIRANRIVSRIDNLTDSLQLSKLSKHKALGDSIHRLQNRLSQSFQVREDSLREIQRLSSKMQQELDNQQAQKSKQHKQLQSVLVSVQKSIKKNLDCYKSQKAASDLRICKHINSSIEAFVQDSRRCSQPYPYDSSIQEQIGNLRHILFGYINKRKQYEQRLQSEFSQQIHSLSDKIRIQNSQRQQELQALVIELRQTGGSLKQQLNQQRREREANQQSIFKLVSSVSLKIKAGL